MVWCTIVRLLVDLTWNTKPTTRPTIIPAKIIMEKEKNNAVLWRIKYDLHVLQHCRQKGQCSSGTSVVELELKLDEFEELKFRLPSSSSARPTQ